MKCCMCRAGTSQKKGSREILGTSGSSWVTWRVSNGVLAVRGKREYGDCGVGYKCGEGGVDQSRDIKERREASCTMGSQMNWVPLWSASVSSNSKSATAFTRDWMLLGVASAYCEKSGTWS